MPGEGNSLDLSITLGGTSFQASGPAAVVMKALEEFKGMASLAPVEEGEPEARTPGNGTASAKPQKSSVSKVPLPQFLASDQIKGNPKIATAIVAWAAAHENKASLTIGDIRQYWKKTTVKAPSNLPRDLTSAEKNGWLDREGKSFSVNGYGRKAIGLS
jgi:hypothetical protein